MARFNCKCLINIYKFLMTDCDWRKKASNSIWIKGRLNKKRTETAARKLIKHAFMNY